MPILDTTLSRIRKYMGMEITVEELDELLFRIGFELDSYKESEGDFELKIEVTPDRPDCLSTVGLVRALKLYLGIQEPKKYVSVGETDYKLYVDKSVLAIRPYIAAFVVKDIRLTEDDIEELIWTQEKLHATFCRERKKASIGFYPLRKITWPLKYYAEDPDKIRFVPLGMDEPMSGREILSKHPTGKKYKHLIEEFAKYPLFVDNNGNVLSMPPIINAREYGEVSSSDTEILVETTGTHKETMKQTLNILATMLSDMGGTLHSVEVIYPDIKERAPFFQGYVKYLHLDYVEKVLGVKIRTKKVKELLSRMGYLIRSIQRRMVMVEVPPYRTDIFHEIDIVDDIARAYGFNNFEPELSPVFTVGSQLGIHDKIDFIREILTGLGYAEIFTFSLTNTEDQFLKMRLDVPGSIVRIAGAKEAKINMVRSWLLPEALKTLVENKAREYPIKMFEISDVVELNEDLEARAQNKTHLVVVISDTRANYTDIKSCIEYVFGALGISINIVRGNHRSFIEGRCALIVLDGKEIGVLGEIHPEVLMNFGITIPTVAAEVDLSDVLKIRVQEVEWSE